MKQRIEIKYSMQKEDITIKPLTHLITIKMNEAKINRIKKRNNSKITIGDVSTGQNNQT